MGIVVGTAALGVPAAAAPIVVEHLMPAYQKAIVEASLKIADLFNKSQSDIVVKVTQVPGSLDDYLEALTTRVAGGTPPDVIRMPARLGDVIGRDLVLPLDNYVQRDGFACKMLPPALPLSSWHGQLVSVPTSYDAFATYYNVDLWNQAGLADPNQLAKSGDWDWHSWVDAAKKMTVDDNADGKLEIAGITTLPGPQNMARFSLYAHLFGAYYFDSGTGPTQVQMNSEAMVSALSYVNDLVNQQQVLSWPQRWFHEGTSGMTPDGDWEIGFIRQGNAKLNWDVAPMPAGPAGEDPVVHVTGFQIAKQSPHPDAAWKWLRFLASDPQAVKIFMTLSGEPPACADIAPSYAGTVVQNGSPQHVGVLIDAVLKAKGTPIIPVVPGYSDFNAAFGKEIKAMLGGKQSPGETANRLQQEFTTILARVNGDGAAPSQ
ncbi:MAG TPA: sugar ABC transporter substrate-binding protein [Limnochordia bacterium]|nr:sugar ABC transporter substrate-binding protein [Limnochordia bacterium]